MELILYGIGSSWHWFFMALVLHSVGSSWGDLHGVMREGFGLNSDRGTILMAEFILIEDR